MVISGFQAAERMPKQAFAQAVVCPRSLASVAKCTNAPALCQHLQVTADAMRCTLNSSNQRKCCEWRLLFLSRR